MAPPSNRRTGFSKRAQYSSFFGYLAAIGGAVVGGGFLIVSFMDPNAFSGLRGFASDVTAPGGRTVATAKTTGDGVFDSIEGFFMSGSRKARLEKEVHEARIRLAEARALAEENARLKALLGLPNEDVKPVTFARLIASTSGGSRRFATLGAGSNRGVANGMPVLSPRGLVGRVLSASSTTSRVLLITDSESTVPVRRARDGVAAFAIGSGDGGVRLRLTNLGPNPLKPGDVFVTSGSGGLYRPGIAVAVVVSLTSDGAIARMLSDPAASEFVIVEPQFAGAIGMPQALQEAAPQTEAR
jgi:rod shape-determining protein MreC